MMVETPIWLLGGKTDKLGVGLFESPLPKSIERPQIFCRQRNGESSEMEQTTEVACQATLRASNLKCPVNQLNLDAINKQFLISIKEKSKAWWPRLPP